MNQKEKINNAEYKKCNDNSPDGYYFDMELKDIKFNKLNNIYFSYNKVIFKKYLL